MILGQRIRLDPNNVQRTFFERCAGAARFIWNQGLSRWQEMHEVGERPNLRNLAAAHAVTACRHGSSGREPSPVKLPLGQESSSYVNQYVHGFSLEWDAQC